MCIYKLICNFIDTAKARRNKKQNNVSIKVVKNTRKRNRTKKNVAQNNKNKMI